jgi:hypothetical protein
VSSDEARTTAVQACKDAKAAAVQDSLDGFTTYMIYGSRVSCPGCGCDLSAYEVFACRIRGLKTPVCLGCLADALVWMKRYLAPMLETALKMLERK